MSRICAVVTLAAATLVLQTSFALDEGLDDDHGVHDEIGERERHEAVEQFRDGDAADYINRLEQIEDSERCRTTPHHSYCDD